jgi:hypothetical protein
MYNLITLKEFPLVLVFKEEFLVKSIQVCATLETEMEKYVNFTKIKIR